MLMINMIFISFVLIIEFLTIVSSQLIWRNLTSTEMNAWYTPVEQCMLNNPDRFVQVQTIKQKCRSSRVVACHIGMGYHGVPCFAPLAGRKSFFKGFDGYLDSSAKPLEKLHNYLYNTNTSLVFIGDSLMRQRVQWFECQFQRENQDNLFKPIIGSTIKEKLPCRSLFHLSLGNDNSKYVELYSLAFTELKAKCPINMGRITHLANALEIIDTINNQNRSALIIFNSGLWWLNEGIYKVGIGSVFDFLFQIEGKSFHDTKKNHIIWLETTAQHWSSYEGNGYYHSPLATQQGIRAEAANFSEIDIELWHTDISCRSTLANATDWRNEIAKEYIKLHGRDRIHYFDLNGTTQTLADMHISHPYKLDCTHYCYAPLLWQPLWHYLANFAEKFL